MLEDILNRTRDLVALRKEKFPLRKPEILPANGRRFADALRGGSRINLIAEVKRGSPTAGFMRPLDAAATAAAYVEGGARAVSVLTEPHFFFGSLEDLEHVARRIEAPVLRKDFILDEYQLYESAARGADAVLLIAAVLPEAELKAFFQLAVHLGLCPLVEVHEPPELDSVLKLDPPVIGVNQRNLKTFRIDSKAELVERIPAGIVRVIESGIRDGDQARKFKLMGYDACLVGEALARSDDPAAAVRKLLE
ncbi:MAG: indole-3-glycerol-phosphate synthase [Planctomycetes bacterium]|nr:indole-3-glycerol-phosphate synthase [Planctomycetota bacterium]